MPHSSPRLRHGLSACGRLFEIVYGDQRAVVSEQGGALRAYTVGDRPVVVSLGGVDHGDLFYEGVVLAPWPNRVVDGTWRWRGEQRQLALTEPARGHALHGLVATQAWQAPVAGHRPDAVQLDVLLLAHPGWPFPLEVTVSYQLGDHGLTSSITAVNVGCEPCPYGAGAHPYFGVGDDVDAARLRLAADEWLEVDARRAPVGRHPTAGTAHDFTELRGLHGAELDVAFCGPARAGDGRSQVTLVAHDGATTTVWGDTAVRWWQVYTCDSLPEPWRRRAVAIEPMTCGPDALNSGDDLVVLEPGERHTMTWGASVAP